MTGSRLRPLIMVVDDDDPTRMMATEFLTQSGFDVVEFEEGLSALENVAEHCPDLIVLDVEMPGLDGFEVCRRLRSLSDFENTPVLMLTGLNDNDSIEVAFEAGATDFSSKPINWTLLCHRLRYMLRARQATEDLVQNQKSLASAQRIAKMGNWQINVLTAEMQFSERLQDLLGSEMLKDHASLGNFLSAVHPNDTNRVTAWFDEIRTQVTDNLSIDFYMISEDSTELFFRQQVEQVVNKDGNVIQLLGVLQDLTDHRKAQHRIKQLANYDRVTGLPNRKLFRERVTEFIDNNPEGSAALLYVDVDDFKQVNDTVGHAVGDVMLNEIVVRIKNIVPDNSVVARMAADEFTILLPLVEGGVDPLAIASDITLELGQPYTLKDGEVFSSACVGVAIYSEHASTADTLLKNADTAMSCAKREGKNTFRSHNEDMDEEAKHRFRIESQMRGALKNAEFELYYQPQIDLSNGKMYSAEALIRWISPELGFVAPDQFINIAEDNGLIVPLGEWVLRTACLQAVEWIAKDFPIQQVAVNISVLQFIRSDFVEVVGNILEETGLEPSFLELEITESLIATDSKSAVETLQKLKDIGVQLSIDDFGTGYSSLSQLKHLPVDRLKLDQSFVQGITCEESDAAIIRAVIAMANSMNVKLLAEGVETIEQLEYLKSCRCDEIQGYYISKPVPADALDQNIDAIHSLLCELFNDKGDLLAA